MIFLYLSSNKKYEKIKALFIITLTNNLISNLIANNFSSNLYKPFHPIKTSCILQYNIYCYIYYIAYIQYSIMHCSL